MGVALDTIQIAHSHKSYLNAQRIKNSPLHQAATFSPQMKFFCIFAAVLFPALSAFSQWSIVSTTAERMEEQTSQVTEDFWLHITLRNDTGGERFIWGQEGFYLVEAFIQEPGSMVWKRKNSFMCGTAGAPSWQSVKAGEEIKLLRREAVRDIGRSIMLTFRTASTSADASRGSEILLGEFKIPPIPPAK